MRAFKLVLDPDSLVHRATGPTIGAIHVEIEGTPFPERGWTDFAIVFLKDYLRAIVKLRKGKHAKVSFFDGPFRLQFRRTGDVVIVEALERGKVALASKVQYADLLEHSMAAVLPWIEHELAVGA
jgi:hypothetical protein